MLAGLAYALIFLATFVGMEAFAWAMHRYVMHSALGWGWHASHHAEPISEEGRRGFELNDLFAVVFATPAILLFWVARVTGMVWIDFLAAGITAYGVMYGVVHDGLVHQRWPWRFRPKRGYARRLVQAHRLHHAIRSREGGVSFGFLYAPDVRRLKARLRTLAPTGVDPA